MFAIHWYDYMHTIKIMYVLYVRVRYTGKIAGLYPSDPLQAALCDEVCDSIEDVLVATFRIAGHSKDENDKKAKSAEFVKQDGSLRYWLDKFVLRIEENAKRGNTKGYFVGDSLTIADIKAVNFAFYVSGMISGADDTNGGNKICQRDTFRCHKKVPRRAVHQKGQ